MNRHLDALFTIVVGGIVGVFVGAFFIAAASHVGPTGPNCPGKDPAWLGYCSEAPK